MYVLFNFVRGLAHSFVALGVPSYTVCAQTIFHG